MKQAILAVAIGIILFSLRTESAEYTFDPKMLGAAGNNVDISLFDQGLQLPGTYLVDIFVNNERVDSRNIVFRLTKKINGESELEPCLSIDELSHYGIKVEEYTDLVDKREGDCARLSVIPQAKVDFQLNNQRLALSIPQIALRPKIQGIAPKQLWDDGEPALLLGYRANTTKTEHKNDENSNSNSSYVQLNPGVNLGAWRLRNTTTWQRQGEESGKWQTLNTYAERGLYGINSRITLGDRFTNGDVFDSIPFRGVMLGSDDTMVPYNQRDFAPVIRGIARTEARVEIKQNGYTIYNASVAPGPFAISDLSLRGGVGGELQVTVWESSGAPQIFTVPYQTPVIALHEGYFKYNAMMGRYRPANSSVTDINIGQMTLMYGLPWDITLYGGLQGAEHYQSSSVGLGVSLGYWGAFSFDTSISMGKRKQHETEHGHVERIRYSKLLEETNTTLTLGSSQYSSSYYSMAGMLGTYSISNDYINNDIWSSSEHRKSELSMMLNQSMGPWGNIGLGGTRTSYWSRTGYDNTYTINYGVGIKGISFSLALAKSFRMNTSGERQSDRQVSLNVSVPLDQWLGGGTNASYQAFSPSNGKVENSVSLNGQSFDRQLSWDMTYRHPATSGSGDGGAVRLSWNGGYGTVAGNYSYSPNMQQIGGDVAGGMALYRYGLTFGQYLSDSDTMALVAAPGASGAAVGGWPGVKTDFRGYTAIGNMMPYQENLISLDPTTLESNAEVMQTDTTVVPTQGALVLAKFGTRIGARALMIIQLPGGKTVPFGSLATLVGSENNSGIVGNNGEVYLTGLQDKGVLVVRWAEQVCRVSYQLPEKIGSTGIYKMHGVCH